MKAAILAYGLPEPTFVLAPIAFALSYGYFACLEMNADSESIVVVPNCGYCFFSVDVFKLQRNKITFLYSSITDDVGGRSLTYLMACMVQEQCAELSVEDVSVNLDDVLSGDEDVAVTLNYKDFISRFYDDTMYVVFREGVQAAAKVGS